MVNRNNYEVNKLVTTLEELKAQNALDEAKAAQNPPVEPEEVEEDAEEVDQEESDKAGEPADESSESESESWMQTDEQTSEGAVPVAKHAAMRTKLKGQVRERDSEIEQLKAELERERSGKAQAQPPQQLRPMPKLADCDYDEDKHSNAVAKWTDERIAANLSAHTQVATKQQQQRAATESISKALDAHYDRAAELVAKQGIAPDLYQAADTKFRSVIEGAMPGRGDMIADFLIANLEEGSEKVAFYVGRNAGVQQTLQAKLLADPSGLKASIYLGELKAKSISPQQRVSTAPKPAAKVGGDEPAGDIVKRLSRQYKEAQKGGDMQSRIDLRRKLRQAGVNPDTL